jgi:GTP cyclohydrolase I
MTQPNGLQRTIDAASRAEMERSIASFLRAAGVDLSDPHLCETPRRVAEAFSSELLSGYETEVASLFKTFETTYEQMVLVRDIPFYSLCAHHLLPFFGTASIAYQPNGRIVGLSKLGRVVETFARRLQVQERLTTEIADALERYLGPRSLIVVLRAEHLCMTMRGVRHAGTHTTSYAMRGDFDTDSITRNQVRDLLLGRHES